MALKNNKADIVVAGGSFIGLCFAIATKQYCPKLNILVLDAGKEGQYSKDERSYAIALDAVNMFEKLRLLQNIINVLQPIYQIKVTDTKIEEVVRLDLFELKEKNHSPIAYMAKARDLGQALYNRAVQLGVVIRFNEKVENFKSDNNNVTIQTSKDATIDAKLLIAADGRFSGLRKMAGITTSVFDYNQSGIVCTVNHERDNHGIAVQHFFPNGPFAILPLKDKQFSLVWSETTERANYLSQLPQEMFIQELEKCMGHYLGKLELASQVYTYPLSLVIANKFIANRFILLGDAAHGIHPLCGQGLNLGFRDCAAAAEAIVEGARLGLDLGTATILERYQKARRSDTVAMGVGTHLINKLFSNNSELLRILRYTGLSVCDKWLSLKSLIIAQANGKANNVPKLLKNMDI